MFRSGVLLSADLLKDRQSTESDDSCGHDDCSQTIHLPAIGVQKGGVEIKQYMLRMMNGIDNLPHSGVDLIELNEGVFIHSVPETGQSGL